MKEIVEQTEQLLEAYKHPEPYRPPEAPGGSKYQRNLPPPSIKRTFRGERLSFWAVLTFCSASDDPQGDACIVGRVGYMSIVPTDTAD